MEDEAEEQYEGVEKCWASALCLACGRKDRSFVSLPVRPSNTRAQQATMCSFLVTIGRKRGRGGGR